MSQNLDIMKELAEETWNSESLPIVEMFQLPFNAILDTFKPVYDLVSVIGIVIMVIFFFIDLQNYVLDKNFDIEILFRNFIKLIIGIAIVGNIGALILGANEFVIALAEDFNGVLEFTLSSDFVKVENIATRYQSSGMPVAASESPSLWAISAIVWAMKIAIYVVIWTLSIKRAIELVAYYILSPIAFADIFSGRVIGVVEKFKGILAVFMELPFVMLAVSFGDLIIKGVLDVSQSGSAIFVTVLVLIAVLKTVGSSKQMLQKIFG